VSQLNNDPPTSLSSTMSPLVDPHVKPLLRIVPLIAQFSLSRALRSSFGGLFRLLKVQTLRLVGITAGPERFSVSPCAARPSHSSGGWESLPLARAPLTWGALPQRVAVPRDVPSQSEDPAGKPRARAIIRNGNARVCVGQISAGSR
jgi:hypothetical protein